MSTARTVIGIDNGSSGTISAIHVNDVGQLFPSFMEIPTVPYLHYGREGRTTARLDRNALRDFLFPFVSKGHTQVFIERPFTGTFLMTCLAAHRFFESTIGVLDDYGLGYEVIDSKIWQKPILGNVKGSEELKQASMLRGIQLYPQFTDPITRHRDADGLLIAHYFFNGGTVYHAKPKSPREPKPRKSARTAPEPARVGPSQAEQRP